jgi:hypothetical protein
MISLRSRVAQARLPARCRAPLSPFATATTIARRTTTATTRRRVCFQDIFTAFYTTILGTAAIFDAKAKDDRREKIDRLLAEAKSSLEDGESLEEEPSELSESKTTYKPIFDPLPMTPAILNGLVNTALSPSKPWDGSQLKLLDSHLRQSLVPPASHAMKTTSTDNVEEDEEWDVDPSLGGPRMPETSVHLKKMEFMIAKLVSRLLLTSKSIQSASSKPEIDISIQMKRMAERIEALECGQTQLPSYKIGHIIDERKARGHLHKTIKELFLKWDPGSSLELLIAKICYNLLVTTVSPSVTTYNILLGSLTRLNQHELGQHVIDSFFMDSKYKPNSTTVCLFLEHYAAKKDYKGFRWIVKRMVVLDHNNMRLKMRRIDTLKQNPRNQQWALTNAVVQRDNVLHQVFLRNGILFDALIKGYMELEALPQVLGQACAAIYHDLLSPQTFYCLVKWLDKGESSFQAARKLLGAFVKRWMDENVPTEAMVDDRFRWAMYRLIALCGDIGIHCVFPRPLSRQFKVLPHAKTPEFKKPTEKLLLDLEIGSIVSDVQAFSECLLDLDFAVRGISNHATGKETAMANDQRYGSIESINQVLDILQEHEFNRLKAYKMDLIHRFENKTAVLRGCLSTMDVRKTDKYRGVIHYILRSSWGLLKSEVPEYESAGISSIIEVSARKHREQRRCRSSCGKARRIRRDFIATGPMAIPTPNRALSESSRTLGRPRPTERRMGWRTGSTAASLRSRMIRSSKTLGRPLYTKWRTGPPTVILGSGINRPRIRQKNLKLKSNTLVKSTQTLPDYLQQPLERAATTSPLPTILDASASPQSLWLEREAVRETTATVP